eukprot:TRINITY_DN4228_c0_g1_i8.p1 TRINITY_DN4228_c0_g1~~TRINITY_DN4228_c0_g1_i8.p1  ORF type:complete len:137 (+),score=21.95 TRINITY_DN4228_c0_g1_i8:498-908(+)
MAAQCGKEERVLYKTNEYRIIYKNQYLLPVRSVRLVEEKIEKLDDGSDSQRIALICVNVPKYIPYDSSEEFICKVPTEGEVYVPGFNGRGEKCKFYSEVLTEREMKVFNPLNLSVSIGNNELKDSYYFTHTAGTFG